MYSTGFLTNVHEEYRNVPLPDQRCPWHLPRIKTTLYFWKETIIAKVSLFNHVEDGTFWHLTPTQEIPFAFYIFSNSKTQQTILILFTLVAVDAAGADNWEVKVKCLKHEYINTKTLDILMKTHESRIGLGIPALKFFESKGHFISCLYNLHKTPISDILPT